jgi:hypothetical protein
MRERKPKFKPTVTRVKLNPEQAVLSCDCYNIGLGIYNYGGTSKTGIAMTFGSTYCYLKGQTMKSFPDPGVSSCAHIYGSTSAS